MPQMTHCQQCRADAVGTLGGCSNDSPPSQERQETGSRNLPYRVAVASNGESRITTHFGHTSVFEIYQFDQPSGAFYFIESRDVDHYCSGQQECAEQEDNKENIIATIADCDLVLCARIGIAPWRSLEKIGVKPNVDFAMQPTADALLTLADSMKENNGPTEAKTDKEGTYEIRHHR